jgi:SET domain-containing protein
MNQDKRNLLHNLKNETFCRIGLSKIHGVGVVAIKDIPKGTNPYKVAGNVSKTYKPVKITKTEYSKLDPGVRKIIGDFIYQEKDGSFLVPKFGMNSMDISFYMNHSKDNNIDLIEDKHDDFLVHVANRNIKKGEELTIDYNDFEG